MKDCYLTVRFLTNYLYLKCYKFYCKQTMRVLFDFFKKKRIKNIENILINQIKLKTAYLRKLIFKVFHL